MHITRGAWGTPSYSVDKRVFATTQFVALGYKLRPTRVRVTTWLSTLSCTSLYFGRQDVGPILREIGALLHLYLSGAVWPEQTGVGGQWRGHAKQDWNPERTVHVKSRFTPQFSEKPSKSKSQTSCSSQPQAGIKLAEMGKPPIACFGNQTSLSWHGRMLIEWKALFCWQQAAGPSLPLWTTSCCPSGVWGGSQPFVAAVQAFGFSL